MLHFFGNTLYCANPCLVPWLEVNHSFRDANSSSYIRYLTLVPATLIIYAGPLFNVINVSSACSTNTDNFLSLRTPQHLHRKAEDSYEIPLLAEVVAGLFHLPMYSGDSEWTGTTAAARWWVRNSGLFHSLLLTPGFTFSAGQGENSKVGPRKIILSFFNAK